MSWWDYGYQIAGMANRTTLGEKHHEMSVDHLRLIQWFISRLFIILTLLRSNVREMLSSK